MRRLVLPLLLACCAASHAAEPPAAFYGQEAIHLAEGDAADDTGDPGGQLREQVIMRAVTDYLREHRQEWVPSEAEIDAATPRYLHALACLPYPSDMYTEKPEIVRFVVAGLIAGNSAQRLLYRNFGGGRVLFQQAGSEAFDATHTLAQALEAQGKFAFATPELRTLAYDYWTRDHGTFLSTPARADTAFDPAALFITCEQAPEK